MNTDDIFAQNILASTKEGNIKWKKITHGSLGSFDSAFKTTQGLTDGYIAYLLQFKNNEGIHDYLLITIKGEKAERAIFSQKLSNSEILKEIFKCAQHSYKLSTIKNALAFIKSDTLHSKSTQPNNTSTPENSSDTN